MTKAETKQQVAKLIIIISCVLIVLNSVLLVYRGITGREKAVADGRVNAERLSRIFSDHVELTYLAVDMVLKRAVERQYFNQLFGNKLNDDILNNFMVWVDETPQISGMLMTDEHGTIKTIYRKRGYETWLEGKETLEDKKLFYILKDSKDVDMFFDVSKDKWISERGLVLMSRRIDNINGSFGGIMVALVDNKYLTGFFNSVEKDKKSKMAILYSGNDEIQELINQFDTPQKEYFRKILDTADINKLHETRMFTKEKDDKGPYALYTLKTIPNLKILIAVKTCGDDIFKAWKFDRINDVIYLVILILFTSVISYFVLVMARQMGVVQRSERTAIMASQAKSEFLANMSHELRTPLNAIIGFSEMMSAGYFGTLNAKQKERITDVHMCGKHLLELINDILEFSKGEAGKVELKESNIDVAKVVSESIRMFNERAKAEGIKINSTVQEGMPQLRADERKIKQVLINLLSNSIKFTERGGNIHINCLLDSNRNFIMTVSDTGVGIAEDDIPKALSVFGQIEKHGDKERGGTGLGLPLSKMFTEMHGGKLKLESIEGVGTKVTIILPSQRLVKTVSPATIAKLEEAEKMKEF